MICIPALLYLVYTIIYILIDIKNNLYNNMILKIWISILVFAVLQVLCSNDLSVIAWLIISIPFIYMVIIMAILIYVVQVDPTTGISTTSNQTSTTTSQPTTSTTTSQSTPTTSQTPTTSIPTITISPTTFGIGL